MNKLERLIRERIELDGPLSIADYMSLCLAHPELGYYTSHHPVGGRASPSGKGGDFITAPEISQMFGELIAVWCMEVWQALDRPTPFNLVEIGPGRGTLMKDLLRAARAMPEFADAAQTFLIEISPTLTEQQSKTLAGHDNKITWTTEISSLPERPSIVVGNELLDALPFRQWIKMGTSWLERAVGLMNNELSLTTRAATLDLAQLPTGHDHAAEGAIFETAPSREAFVQNLAERLKRDAGAALLIDYGHCKSGFGDTFQALRNHEFCSVLDRPGQADLTSHVDFEPLVKIAKKTGCSAPDPATQAEFLLSLGLLERAGSLGAGKSKAVQDSLHAAVNRLAGDDQMGKLFKVMAFGSPVNLAQRWPGFNQQ